MNRIIALTLGVLMAATMLSIAPVDGQSDVTFERETQWIVSVDGDIVSRHNSQSDAKLAGAELRRAMPGAYVAYTDEVMYVATGGPPPPPPTPSPVPSRPTQPPPTPVPPTPVPPTPVPPTPVPPTPIATPPAPGGELVWGYDTTPLSEDWTKPNLYEPYLDPAYGTSVTRVTSAEGTRFNRNTYSRRQAENSTGTMFFTYHGTAAYYVYARMTGSLVRALPIHPDAEPQWHPTNPNLIRYIDGPNSYDGDLLLFEIDVTTGAITTIADLRDRIRAEFPTADYMKDRAEGSASADGHRYAWLIYDTTERIIGVVSYDLATDTVLGMVPIDDLAASGRLDALSMSPTGSYVVAQFDDGTYVYDADLSNERLIFPQAEHSDIALGLDGQDVYVYIDFTATATGGWLTAVDLATLTPALIFDLYDGANTSIHISGKGYNKPGWVVASTYNCHAGFAWSCFKIMAVELVPNGRVLNLAHTYNCGESYWTETHGTVNRDFTRVYFNSDGGSCGIDAEVYVVDVPGFR